MKHKLKTDPTIKEIIMTKILFTLVALFVVALLMGCGSDQKEMSASEISQSLVDKEVSNEIDARKAFFTGMVEKDLGIVKYDPKSGDLLSGKNVYREFVKLIQGNPQSQTILVRFVDKTMPHVDGSYVIGYDRVTGIVSMVHKLGDSENRDSYDFSRSRFVPSEDRVVTLEFLSFSDVENRVIEWASNLASLNNMMKLW